jgi:hypothetical protein
MRLVSRLQTAGTIQLLSARYPDVNFCATDKVINRTETADPPRQSPRLFVCLHAYSTTAWIYCTSLGSVEKQCGGGADAAGVCS